MTNLIEIVNIDKIISFVNKEYVVKTNQAIVIFLFLLFASFMCTVTSCSTSHNGQMTIIHTNDMHSQYAPMKATWVKKEPKPEIGGMVALQYFIEQQRSKYPTSLLLDAGDILTGTPISKIKVHDVYGGGFVDMINLIGYNAFTIGNHEFDEGQENLKKLIQLFNCDVLSANLFTNGQMFVDKAYSIYKVGNLRVGVIGLILKDLAGVTAQKNLAGITVADPAKTAQKYIDEIDAKTDLIILLAHEGVDEDIDLAGKIHNADIIVGGHSHTRLAKPIEKNHMLIVQAGSKTRYVGRLTVNVAGDTVSNFEYQLVPMWVDSVKNPNPQMAALVDKYRQQIDQEYNKQIGTLLTDWGQANNTESNLGDFLTDAVRDVCQTDFAVLNSGGIRKTLAAGPITKLNIVEILPFSNYLVKFKCTGAQLMTLMQTNAQSAVDHSHGILQVAGIKYKYRVEKGGKAKIVSAKINGRNIDPKATYSGATVDFVINGQSQKYFGFEPADPKDTGLLISDSIIDYIIKHPQVNSIIENRMQKIR